MGACLWDGALVLAAYLLTLPRHRFHGMRCVELGAGVGTLGLVAAGLGAQVSAQGSWVGKAAVGRMPDLGEGTCSLDGVPRSQQGVWGGSVHLPIPSRRHSSAECAPHFPPHPR